MSARIAIYGRLGRDSKSIETKSGVAMAANSIAVDLGGQDESDAEPEWFAMLAFGRQADELMRQSKGDLVSIAGRLQRNTYTTKSGEQRSELQVVVDSIVSSRSVRPSGGRKKQSDAAPFDDSIPF